MTHCKPIKRIDIIGYPNFGDRVMAPFWPDVWHKYKAEGVTLPTWQQLKRIGDHDAIWVMPDDFIIRPVFDDGEWVKCEIKKGFAWDKISSPVGRNNRDDELIPALFHDPSFSLHPFYPDDNNKGFRVTNRIFYEMLRCKQLVVNGEPRRNKRPSWLRSRIDYRAVSSIPGRAYYENNERAFWHSQTAEFTFSGDRCWE